MHILMLGGTGFLGGNIVYKLVDKGYKVTCAIRENSNIERIKSLDINIVSSSLESLEVFLKHNKVDWIINGVCTYKSNNTEYRDLLNSNLIFPLSVLNLAIKYNIHNFITIGTSLDKNLNIYSFSKKQFAEFGEFLARQHKILFYNLCLEMFYGGIYEPTDRFISSCVMRLQRNEDIDLTEGLQKRDIIRVEDVVEIIARLINGYKSEGYYDLPVGSGEQHSIREILEYMKKAIGSKSVLKFGKIPSRVGEPDTLADISWYKEIGFELNYSFFEGLAEECDRKLAIEK